ncbi:MAG TPA: hypothetical protein DCP57_08850 [Gammaproteobacteria bacterium]|nr:hypothetical protein [Gammaproteobacteria bacterium]
MMLAKKFIKSELKQRKEEGCDTQAIAERIQAALASDASEAEFESLYDELVALPIADTFEYQEPSTLDEIQQLRGPGTRRYDLAWDEAALYDKIYGAWLGRAAGCALGKPVEGWPKKRINEYLSARDALPLDDYVPFDEKVLPDIHRPSTRGNISFMDRDDDMDFPILGLLALERRGAKTTARGIANIWLASMPFSLLYTAENAAYRNFVVGTWPPTSATHRNPFREWIGAQIRADIFGYAAPGWPERAAALAYQDASISHTKNGIYGEMFVAAMIAAAFVLDDAEEIILAGLAEIPSNCRLAQAIRDTLGWCREEADWESVWEKVNAHYGHYHGVHTINNAAVVVLGVYYGNHDYERGIVVSVLAGWDTDCNGATVGSILGVKFGAKALPEKWVGVLNDRLISAVRGEGDNEISSLAQRTLAVAKQVSADTDSAEAKGPPGNATGIWFLESEWGDHRVDFAQGTVAVSGENFADTYPIRASNVDNGTLTFAYTIDKGGWDFVVDFDGFMNGDQLDGALYPGGIPAKGKRLALA